MLPGIVTAAAACAGCCRQVYARAFAHGGAHPGRAAPLCAPARTASDAGVIRNDSMLNLMIIPWNYGQWLCGLQGRLVLLVMHIVVAVPLYRSILPAQPGAAVDTRDSPKMLMSMAVPCPHCGHEAGAVLPILLGPPCMQLLPPAAAPTCESKLDVLPPASPSDVPAACPWGRSGQSEPKQACVPPGMALLNLALEVTCGVAREQDTKDSLNRTSVKRAPAQERERAILWVHSRGECKFIQQTSCELGSVIYDNWGVSRPDRPEDVIVGWDLAK